MQIQSMCIYIRDNINIPQEQIVEISELPNIGL